MMLLKNQLVNLFDKYRLSVPPKLKCHQDGIPGRRVLFIDDKKGTITVSFEENMKLMDMDENIGKSVPTASYQLRKDGKYIHLRRH